MQMKKRRFQGSHTLQLEDITGYFNVPLTEAAKELGMSASLLKRVCRRFGISRWPFRALAKCHKDENMLESHHKMSALTGSFYMGCKNSTARCPQKYQKDLEFEWVPFVPTSNASGAVPHDTSAPIMTQSNATHHSPLAVATTIPNLNNESYNQLMPTIPPYQSHFNDFSYIQPQLPLGYVSSPSSYSQDSQSELSVDSLPSVFDNEMSFANNPEFVFHVEDLELFQQPTRDDLSQLLDSSSSSAEQSHMTCSQAASNFLYGCHDNITPQTIQQEQQQPFEFSLQLNVEDLLQEVNWLNYLN